ncbi:hypothetical protein KAR48_05185 [bacterium]|nr:hypothetical protein [bacterium]
MKRFILLVLFSLPLMATAQEAISIFGYFESQFMGAKISDEFVQLQSNKLRLDLEGQIGESVKFGANFNYITYHGKTEWPVLDLLPEAAQSEAVLLEFFGIEMNPYVLPFVNRQYLDNAYIKLAFTGMDITVGKQQLSFGSGYAWNPTDIFNTKDLMDPAYEQPGHNGIRLDWPLSNLATFTAVYSPQDNWTSSTKMLQLKATLGRFDCTIIGAETMWQPHDYTQITLDLLAPGFVQIQDECRMIGFNMAGELFGLGVWGEFAMHYMDNSDDYEDLLIGMDYTFENGSYVIAEYFRSGIGIADKEDYSLNDWMRFLAAEQKTLARDQIYAMALFSVTDFMRLGLSAIAVLSDGSAALLPTMNWTLLENVEITAYGNIYLGEDDALYHSGMGNGGLVRARVYF